MPSRITRTFARSLTIVPAILLLRVGAAAGADSVDDVLRQQRDVLAGRTAAVSAPSDSAPRGSDDRSVGDAQESARRLLLGVTPGALPPGIAKANGERGRGDAQLAAQHLLRGGHGASPLGS